MRQMWRCRWGRGGGEHRQSDRWRKQLMVVCYGEKWVINQLHSETRPGPGLCWNVNEANEAFYSLNFIWTDFRSVAVQSSGRAVFHVLALAEATGLEGRSCSRLLREVEPPSFQKWWLMRSSTEVWWDSRDQTGFTEQDKRHFNEYLTPKDSFIQIKVQTSPDEGVRRLKLWQLQTNQELNQHTCARCAYKAEQQSVLHLCGLRLFLPPRVAVYFTSITLFISCFLFVVAAWEQNRGRRAKNQLLFVDRELQRTNR